MKITGRDGEYKILHDSLIKVQTVLNQWKHNYSLTFVNIAHEDDKVFMLIYREAR
jgi:hypothetical protein